MSYFNTAEIMPNSLFYNQHRIISGSDKNLWQSCTPKNIWRRLISHLEVSNHLVSSVLLSLYVFKRIRRKQQNKNISWELYPKTSCTCRTR